MFYEEQYRNLRYIITKPENYVEGQKYPAIIFFHGAGTRGEDMEVLKGNSFYALSMCRLGECFTFAPLCSSDSWFDIFEQSLDFCEHISHLDAIDCNRVYLIGNSMGGYAVWQLAMSKPELFAGIVPICGGGMYWNGARLKNMPIWAFHGEDDDCVHMEESVRMVDSINWNGGSAKLTLYPNTGHDSWTQTYNNPEVFEWLFAQRKGSNETLRTEFNDAKTYG